MARRSTRAELEEEARRLRASEGALSAYAAARESQERVYTESYTESETRFKVVLIRPASPTGGYVVIFHKPSYHASGFYVQTAGYFETICYPEQVRPEFVQTRMAYRKLWNIRDQVLRGEEVSA